MIFVVCLLKKSFLLKNNVAQKFAVLLGRPTLLLFVPYARSSFSLDLLAGYTVLGCYEITMPTLLPRLSPSGSNPTLP